MGVLHKQWLLSDIAGEDVGRITGGRFEGSSQSVIHQNYFDYVNDILHVRFSGVRNLAFCIYTGEMIEPPAIPSGEIAVGSTVIITAERYYCRYGSGMVRGDIIPIWLRSIPHIVLEDNRSYFLLEAENGIRSQVERSEVMIYADWRGG